LKIKRDPNDTVLLPAEDPWRKTKEIKEAGQEGQGAEARSSAYIHKTLNMPTRH
jgi:hypothetical protein